MTPLPVKAAERLCNHPLWADAVWAATSYRCHPSGKAPPVMGLVFADPEKGLKLFGAWTDDWGNVDEDDVIRLAVVEGEIPGQMPGYSIHIYADSQGAGPGQTQRLHPSPETEPMLGQFKAQYLLHGEFLLCPVIQKDCGQLWFNANAGIIKHQITFRNADDISENDIDAIVLKPTPVERALYELHTRSFDQFRSNA